METPDQYDSWQLFKEIEENKREVPDQIRIRLLQLLIACATLENGQWTGQSVFFVLNTLLEIAREDINAAKQLDEPDQSLELRKSTMLWLAIRKIRRDLEDQLRDPPRAA